MKYESFQQLIDTMDAAGYDYKSEISEIEQRKKSIKSRGFDALDFSEHIRTMIYSQLSNNRPWKTIEANRNEIDKIFGGYDIKYLKFADPDELTDKIKSIRCGNRQIKNQLCSLKANIETLERIVRDYGTLGAYYQNENLVDVIKSLSQGDGKYKLKYMGTALVCEYLKGLGIEVIKPDSLLCRLLGRLGYSKKVPATSWEAIEICRDIGDVYGMSQTMVDTILWQYCAEGKFELCTASPKCNRCMVVNCKYKTAR